MDDTIEDPNELSCNCPALSQMVTRAQIPIAETTALRRDVPSIVNGGMVLNSGGVT